MRLHAKAIAHSAGGGPLQDPGRLDSAVAQPRAAFGGVQFHPTLADKAAAYLFFIAKAHAFKNGNKRAAVMAAHAFLGINGFAVHASTDEFERVVLGLVKDQISRADASAFFASRMVPRTR